MVYTLDFQAIRNRGGDELVDKVKTSLKVIEKAFSEYKYDEITVSYNGGKDSVVLIELVNQVFLNRVREEGGEPKKLRAIFFSSKNSFEEVDEFMWETAKLYNLEVDVIDKSFKEGLKLLTEPDESSKAKPLKAIFMGTRYSDPGGKNVDHFTMTDSDWPQVMRVNPIIDWSYKNVWDFILALDLPYCCLYKLGFTSIGDVNNTQPNKELLDKKSNKYLPAWELKDESKERCGRI